MKTSDFDYNLPQEYIAQKPAEPRDSSRLLVLNRQRGELTSRIFGEITEYFKPGDVLVMNNSRVLPARIKGIKRDTAAKIEILLLKRDGDNCWEALLKPGKRTKPGTIIDIHQHGEETSTQAEVLADKDDGIKLLRFSDETHLMKLGEVPLPPYIHTPVSDPERYQTVYALTNGSVAAPTAGLHFTTDLLKCLSEIGVICTYVTLHIGLDTFRPVKEEDPNDHIIHREYGILSAETAATICQAKANGKRVFCVGTSATRLVEQASSLSQNGIIEPYSGWADLFILPGYKFRVVDCFITNFHLPRSTPLMLTAAFAGWPFLKKAYEKAIHEHYRFYSFGDAMLVL
ncbi:MULTISPECIES: tRNA preQ1(34) S-adenosylmethionine ribosyltransferase-isomerase QueA [Dehalococcoides]|jgi:S-adenosylmethionine:tRNA ribosyltransferase-isomerase|uniref:tRNA preQ1(34) S-adenosylmethionine ribosyltransferase-isomerase QueA n=1 Tax=Dehalococcoides TaxID=61434 RepID=UPI0003C86DF6|nr:MULTISPECIES: tRNA preQ1(34) S-adenosylmethionine ribosyltransferase-isomerase QueA [Dehalococcoides]AHB13497.1 S-adenosylmethionine:tRNA ribosyltransferase-isomerase [Dehalococcoides mccartyi GY50]AII57883.1 S-adenosylmethionine tRNA ribosyltransferase [Dehalococcoides mccartyi CG1]APH12355.1 S-adenosylmethionine:tRNA ribosyltransferase-isomerase [Dehalococcoides mccartyi]QYY58076.1 tRNA preQ1(34) S-adenosylmethionine ribosyltransferase-isomerase QueA [Dehalococcoides mccartyi]BAQ34627.1 S